MISSASCLVWQSTTKSSAYLISTGESFLVRPALAGRAVADSGGLLHPVQSDVQQQRADHTALRNTVLGAMQPTLLDHASLQPLPDHSPGGERADHGLNVIVGDAVERPGQIRVQHPQSLRALALGDLVDGLDRVMAAAAGPEPIGLRLEPRLPLGLQRVDDPCLMARDRRSRESLMAGAWLLPGFGMYTRLTGAALNGSALCCTLSTNCILASGVSTTSPSTPAVRRPALRSVTRRTLTSVFARERSINFCNRRTLGRSPAFDAVKIRCRNRRTSASARRQSTWRQRSSVVLWSTHHPTGAVAASSLSSGSGVIGHLPLHRLT